MNGMSDIEGKAARVAATECRQRRSFKRRNQVPDFLGFVSDQLPSSAISSNSNGASGSSDMARKAAR